MKFYPALSQSHGNQFRYVPLYVENLLVSAESCWTGKKFKKVKLPLHNSLFIDSGGFNVMSKYGGYPWKAEDYNNFINKVNPDLVATMDYACEPNIAPNVSTKERIDKTIENTIKNFELLDGGNKTLVPVIQGWLVEDYLYCIDRMRGYGLITDYMAVGSMCRRSANDEILKNLKAIKRELPAHTKLHLFGAKVSVLKDRRFWGMFDSCDSQAWIWVHQFGHFLQFEGNKLVEVDNRRGLGDIERGHKSFKAYNEYVQFLIKGIEDQKSLHDFAESAIKRVPLQPQRR